MNKLLDNSVIKYPEFEKVANLKLSKTVMDWNEEIMNHFFQKVNYLPKDVAVDISISNVDENNGYAKGSVVVQYGDKKVNYPIIVKKFELSPFDVFIHYKNGKANYYNSTKNNVYRLLSSDSMGTLENMYQNTLSQDIKLPGNIAPKKSTDINDETNEAIQNYTGILHKMSSDKNWRNTAKKEDLEKFAEELEKSPGISHAFQDNTGDLAKKIVELKDKKVRHYPNDHKQGILDVKDAIEARQAVVALDSEFFDVSSLSPVKAPAVCELRKYEYPSMEDFMESGQSAYSRFTASKVGSAVPGVVLDLMNPIDFKGDIISKDSNLDQIFISADGKLCSIYNDGCDRKGFGFYGSKVMESNNMLEKIVKMIEKNTINENISFSKYNRGSHANKLLAPSKPYSQDADNSRNGVVNESCSNADSFPKQNINLICIYGAKNSYEAIQFSGDFKRASANDSQCFISKGVAVIPAKVAYPQAVSNIDSDPVYKMITGNSQYILLVPEDSIFINCGYMNRISPDSFMKPSLPVQKLYEKSGINKISMDLGDQGYIIKGKAVEPLYKIAGLSPEKQFNTSTAKTILGVLGLNKEASEKAMKVILNRASLEKKASVDIYNVNSDYIKPNAFEGIEKMARVKGLMKKIASDIRVNLIKEASMLEDPDSVDVMLSLNFINEDNLMDYVENIDEIRKLLSKLASMLIASRMGLNSLDESAISNSIEGLQRVLEGLEAVKMSLGK
jgi:hypothetical protein